MNRNISRFTVLSVVMLLAFLPQVQAQFGYGFNLKTGIYHRYTNPDDDISYRSSGSALLNLGGGPKLWIGGEDFSISAEGGAMISPFAVAVKEFKGLGAAEFPFMAKLNFQGLSGLNKEGKFGLSIGGGIQWSRTELFGLKGSYDALGVERKLFKTYIGEVAYGFGMSGFTMHAYLRYGKNADTGANLFSLGIGYDFNMPYLKELTNPEF